MPSTIQCLLVAGLLSLLLATSYAEDSYELPVQIHNITTDKGHILLAVYSAASGASWQDAPLQSHAIPANTVQDGRLQYAIQGLHAGDYAIRLFHDENDNQRLDMADNGLPLESFAFSADITTAGIPRLEELVFTLPLAENRLNLTLKHPQAKNKTRISP